MQAAAASGCWLEAARRGNRCAPSRAPDAPASIKIGGGVRSSFVESAQRSIGPALRDVSQLTGPASTSPSTTGAIHANRPGDTVQAIIADDHADRRVPAREPHRIVESQRAVIALLRLPARIEPGENLERADRLRHHQNGRDQHREHRLDQQRRS